MFRIRSILAITVIALAFGGCDSIVSPIDDPGSAPALGASETAQLAAALQTESGASTQKSPIVSFWYLPCLGDLIKLEGEVHIVMRSIETDEGDTIHEIDRRTYTLEGTGLITGNRYRVLRAFATGENYRIPSGETATHQMNVRVVEPGSGQVFTARSLEHMTINAQGEVTVDIDEFSGECSP